MLFGSCNLKIVGLYPRLDQNGMGDYYFSFGVKKTFAKKCFEEELNEEGYNRLETIGKRMITKVFGEGYMSLFTGSRPYEFFKNKDGKNTCLISNLTAPGDRCGLDVRHDTNIERELNNINQYQNFIEYHPHNIDNPRQCYVFLSLLTSWEDIMDCRVNPIKE